MQIDFWRAAGIVYVSGFVASIIWFFTLPLWNISPTAFDVKEFIGTAAIAALGTFLYFYRFYRSPSAREAFNFGLMMLVLPFIFEFMVGFAEALSGQLIPTTDPRLSPWSMILEVPLIPLTTFAMGWYLARNK